MSLSDTAEYWNDVKKQTHKRVFTHSKGLDCGHHHICESDELQEINCYACKKIIDLDADLKNKLEQNNGKAYQKYRNKKGCTLDDFIWFGKYKGKNKTIQWIIENDRNYFEWLKPKLLLHTEIDEFLITLK